MLLGGKQFQINIEESLLQLSFSPTTYHLPPIIYHLITHPDTQCFVCDSIENGLYSETRNKYIIFTIYL